MLRRKTRAVVGSDIVGVVSVIVKEDDDLIEREMFFIPFKYTCKLFTNTQSRRAYEAV
jgi:hypothetical protein